MRAAWAMLLVLTAAVLLAAGVAADEKPAEKTLKGEVTCAKCGLKQADACATVLVVKDGTKSVVYFFDEAAHKKYHEEICLGGKKGAVTGTVSEKGGKKTIKVEKVELQK
jgi:hypothetical protein